MHHAMLAVEGYRLSIDRPGSFGDEVIVSGWFLSHGRIDAMHLVYPGGHEIEIVERAIPSDGVYAFHGEVFGEQAKACRFEVVEPIGARELDLAAAVLRIRADAVEFNVEIGPQLQLPERVGYTAEERALIMRFESCGDNCEFGLVQRRVGTERLGLLRYAGVGDIGVLSNAIENRFCELEWPNAVIIGPHGNEWMAHVPSLRVALHTGRSIESISRDRIAADETTKLTFMAQKFLDDCEEADKVFVYRVHRDERGGPNGIRGIDRLYEVMSQHGPIKLLWVNEADDDHPHRTVEHVRDGLFRGWIDHLAPHSNAFDFRPRSWLELLAEAERVIAEVGRQTRLAELPEPTATV